MYYVRYIKQDKFKFWYFSKVGSWVYFSDLVTSEDWDTV